MSNLENNKILAAVLTAGIVFMLTGFITDKVFETEEPEKDAVSIEGASASGHEAGVSNKPKLPDPIMALLAEADIARGAKISKACASCHTFNKGGSAKQGPNLWGIINRPKAAKAGFSYSDAVKNTGGKWDYNSINNFLWKPKRYISGTKMNFVGLKKTKDRAALIAWLRQQADTQELLPTPEEIAAEQLAFAPPAEEEHHEDETENDGEKGEHKEAAPENSDNTMPIEHEMDIHKSYKQKGF